VTPDRAELIAAHDIGVVVDAGANEGLFARRLRDDGYTGRIISFEPLSSVFVLLALAAGDDPGWECHRLALGSGPGELTLQVAQNLASSSFLAIEDELRTAEARVATIGSEECAVTTLDILAPELFDSRDRLYLKLDVQGFELEALRGAAQTMEQVAVLDVELSETPLYRGAPSADEVVAYLADRGYRLLQTEPAYLHPQTHETLQVNGIFVRDTPQARRA
jgi:FkbM family methyltransferase